MTSWNNSPLKRIQSEMERENIGDNSLKKTGEILKKTNAKREVLNLQVFQLLNKKMKQQKLKHEKYYKKIKQSLGLIGNQKKIQYSSIKDEVKRQIMWNELQLRKQIQEKDHYIRQLKNQCEKLNEYKNETRELKEKIKNKDSQLKKIALLKDNHIEKLNEEIQSSRETIRELQQLVERYMQRQRKKQSNQEKMPGQGQSTNIQLQIENLRLQNIKIRFEKQRVEKQLAYLNIEKAEQQKQFQRISVQLQNSKKQQKKAKKRVQQLQSQLSEKQRIVFTKNTTLLEQISNLKSNLHLIQQQNTQLIQRISILQTKNKQSEKEISTRDVKISNLQQNQKRLQLKISQSEKQFISLLTDSKVDELQTKINAKNKQISDLKNSISHLKEAGRKKSEQIFQLKSSYTPIQLGDDDDQQESFTIKDQNFDDSFEKQEEQQHILQAELQIIKCKYNLLEKMYVALQKQRVNDRGSLVNAAVQTEQLSRGLVLQIEPQGDEYNMRKSLSNISQRPLKKNLSGYSLFKQPRKDGKLDLSIAGDSTIHNKYSDLNSPASAYNFVNLFQQSELESKIKQFSFNNSILNKVNNSRFITTPSSKVSLIFQYACYLELYFSPRFLNTALQQLIMGEQMQVKKLSKNDMICQLIDDGQTSPLNNSSFLSSSVSSSKPRSSNKMYIANQFSMNSIQKGEGAKLKVVKLKLCSCTYTETIFYSTKSIKKIEMREKMKEMEKNFRQIKQSFSPNRKSREERTNPEMTEKLKELKNNDVAIYLLKIMDQNEAMKKCLNEMIKSQEIFTKKNNQICFEAYPYDQTEAEKTERQHSTGSQIVENPPERIPKQNCHIM